jgi:aminoglycoside phosphotransferase (APT) family kinase protein
LHPDEIDIDESVVKTLLASQFPEWANLPLEFVPTSGTDNVIIRLGEDMVVRLPRHESAVTRLEAEHRWLPGLAPLLPLSVPEPLALGHPDRHVPWSWAISRWLDGEPATNDRIDAPQQGAAALGRFVAAMQRIDPSAGPTPGAWNSFRGAPLASRDGPTQHALAALGDTVPTVAVTAAWEAALGAPPWEGPGVWIHGDLQVGNLLARAGRLDAVIDFGCMCVGDPAGDVMAAWTYLTGNTRARFRAELAIDDATWERGRGWALSMGLIALPYYRETNPVFADVARRMIDEVLTDLWSGRSDR